MNESNQNSEVCPRCKNRVKDWEGSDPICAFTKGFFAVGDDNWNCATMNALRSVVFNDIYSEDQSFASLSVPDEPAFVVLSWYKSRGKTDFAAVIFPKGVQPLTVEIAEAVIKKEEGQ